LTATMKVAGISTAVDDLTGVVMCVIRHGDDSFELQRQNKIRSKKREQVRKGFESSSSLG